VQGAGCRVQGAGCRVQGVGWGNLRGTRAGVVESGDPRNAARCCRGLFSRGLPGEIIYIHMYIKT
jgi:hypothetical protein